EPLRQQAASRFLRDLAAALAHRRNRADRRSRPARRQSRGPRRRSRSPPSSPSPPPRGHDLRARHALLPRPRVLLLPPLRRRLASALFVGACACLALSIALRTRRPQPLAQAILQHPEPAIESTR